MTQDNALTPREREVAGRVLAGESNKQIAAGLHITESTVEFHLKNIYQKLGVGSRVELVIKLGASGDNLRVSTVAPGPENAVNDLAPVDAGPAGRLRGAGARLRRELKMERLWDVNSGVAPVTFFDAIRACLAKYADFSGRAARPEFWWFALFVTLVTGALAYLSEAAAAVGTIALLLPLLAVGARRLRDAGHSAWWLLFLLAPVGGLVVVGVLCAAATKVAREQT